MRNLAALTILLMFTLSCASGNVTTQKQKEIAVATQRLGEQYYAAGEYTAALRNLLEAYKTIPEDPYLNNSLGLVYMAKDRYDLATDHFIKALDIKPDYIQAKNNLGAAYLKQEKWDLAIQCFKAVSGNLLYATPEVPLSNLGWAYYHQGLYRKANEYFQKSLDIQPDFLISVHGKISTLTRMQHYREAIEYTQAKLKKHPGAAILHADMARIWESLRDYEKAKKYWRVVLSLVPETSPLAKEAREKL